jgi:hypothetical protein
MRKMCAKIARLMDEVFPRAEPKQFAFSVCVGESPETAVARRPVRSFFRSLRLGRFRLCP